MMGEATPLTELIEQIRSKTADQKHLIASLRQDATDMRARRIIELFGEIAPAAEAICTLLEQILQLCQDAPALHRGYNPHLLLLHQDLTTAANFHSELSNRAHLYLQHMLKMGSSFSADILCPIDSTISEQQQLASQLRFGSYQLLNSAVSRAPRQKLSSPGAKQSTAVSREEQMRPLFENKPIPISKQYDARWDPDCRVPGSQYGKFLRLRGPFFISGEEEESICDNFVLPESAGVIIDAWLSKYETVRTNLEQTRRLPRRTKQGVIEAFATQQKSVNLTLAKISGLPYDPSSINLFTRIDPQDTASMTSPFLSFAQRIKMNRLEMGTWEFEDLNRVLVTQMTRSRNTIATMGGGRQVYFDRHLNRNVTES